MTDVDSSLGQEIVDVAQRQRVLDVHHHRQPNYLWRAVEIAERIAHRAHLPRPRHPRRFGLTLPVRRLSVPDQALCRRWLPGTGVPERGETNSGARQRRDRQAIGSSQQGFVALPQALDRRTHLRLARPLPTTRQGLGTSPTTRPSPSCASPPSASCCENYAIPQDVLKQTSKLTVTHPTAPIAYCYVHAFRLSTGGTQLAAGLCSPTVISLTVSAGCRKTHFRRNSISFWILLDSVVFSGFDRTWRSF